MDAHDPLRASLAAAWPVFGLEIRSERLRLRLPTDEELLELMALARKGIHPADSMPFATAWSTMPSPDFERNYLEYHWGNRATWSPESWELGLAILTPDGQVIGMQGVQARRFAELRMVHTGSWLGRRFQGQGYGTEMRAAVLSFAFDGLGALVAETEAFLDNAQSNGVSHSLGYAENGLGSLAPAGVPRETQRFRMTEPMWRSRPRPPATIIGLDGCRDRFGA